MTVNGIGGLFFRSANPDARAAWYQEHLGVNAGQTELWQQEAGITVFAPFPKETDYFDGDQACMLNFRVDDVEALAARLEAAGIEVERRDEWMGTEYGTFIRIHDPEGLPIELWEPPAA